LTRKSLSSSFDRSRADCGLPDTNVKPFKCFTCHMSFARRCVQFFLLFTDSADTFRLVTFFSVTTPYMGEIKTIRKVCLQTMASSPSLLVVRPLLAATVQRQRPNATRSSPAAAVLAETSSARCDRLEERPRTPTGFKRPVKEPMPFHPPMTTPQQLQRAQRAAHHNLSSNRCQKLNKHSSCPPRLGPKASNRAPN
jgi:hypothetical protein